jgi:hypothetical protein
MGLIQPRRTTAKPLYSIPEDINPVSSKDIVTHKIHKPYPYIYIKHDPLVF